MRRYADGQRVEGKAKRQAGGSSEHGKEEGVEERRRGQECQAAQHARHMAKAQRQAGMQAGKARPMSNPRTNHAMHGEGRRMHVLKTTCVCLRCGKKNVLCLFYVCVCVCKGKACGGARCLCKERVCVQACKCDECVCVFSVEAA